MNRRKNGILTICAYIFIFELLGIGISLLLQSIILALKLDYTIFSPLSNFTIYLVLLIALIVINKSDLKEDLKVFSKTKGVIGALVLIVLICYGANYLSSVISSSIEEQFNSYLFIMGPKHLITSGSNNQSDIVAMLQGKYWFLMFIPAAIFGPICEELVFRKAIFDVTGKNKELGLIISSIAFVSIHLISSIGKYDFVSLFLMFISYLGPAIAFGIIYMKKGNIVYTTIAHIIMNVISMILIMLFY